MFVKCLEDEKLKKIQEQKPASGLFLWVSDSKNPQGFVRV